MTSATSQHLRRGALLIGAACVAIAWSLFALARPAAGADPWTPALLSLALALPIWCCLRRHGDPTSPGIDLLQPGTVAAGIFYMYTVIPAFHVWHDLDYHSAWVDPTWPAPPVFRFALVLSLLSLVAFGLGYRIPYRRPLPENPPAFDIVRAHWPRAALPAAVAMLVIGFPYRLYHFAAFGGFSRDIFLFLSPGYQVESGVRIAGVATLFEQFFDWGALLFLFDAFANRKRQVLALCVVAVAVAFAYFESGKRSAVVPFLLYPVIWLHYFKRRLSVRRGAVYLSVGGVLVTALLFMRSLGPLLANRGVSLRDVPADVALAPVEFYLNSPDLAVFDMTMLATQDRAALLREIGGAFSGGIQYNVLPFTYVIPRALWPGKPVFSDLGAVFYQHSEGGREDVGFAVGIVGGLYLFGGVIGVLLGMFVVGLLFRMLYDWLAPWRRDPRNVFLYGIAIWTIFHLLRFGEVGGTVVYFYQFDLPGVVVAMLVLGGRRARSTPARASEPSLSTG